MAGYGMRAHARVQFQNSYGTALTTSLHSVAFRSEGFDHVIDSLVEGNMYARYAEPPRYEGPNMITGALEMDANPIALGHFLRSAFGYVLTTSVAGQQSHVFLPVTSDFDTRAAVTPMTVLMHRDVGSAMLYSDMLVNQLTLSIVQGQLMTVNADFMGAHASKAANPTPVFPVATPFRWDQVSASYNGQAMTDLRNIELRFNNNLEVRHVLGNSNTPYRIKRSNFQEVVVQGTATFAVQSLYDAFRDQLENRMLFNFAGNESPNNLTWDMGTFRFTKFTPQVTGPGVVEASFEGRGVYSVSSGEAVRVTLVNTQEYY